MTDGMRKDVKLWDILVILGFFMGYVPGLFRHTGKFQNGK